jgi:hypothetical protein
MMKRTRTTEIVIEANEEIVTRWWMPLKPTLCARCGNELEAAVECKSEESTNIHEQKQDTNGHE